MAVELLMNCHFSESFGQAFSKACEEEGAEPSSLSAESETPVGVPAIKQVYMSNNEPPKVIKGYFRRFCYFL